MNSVERRLHYAYRIEQDPAHEIDRVDSGLKASGWPRAGRVQFQSLTLSHRPGLDPALRDVTLDIKPGEKLVLWGALVLERLLVSAFCDLATFLPVISQDSVLLAGTIRYNQDPCEKYDGDWLH